MHITNLRIQNTKLGINSMNKISISQQLKFFIPLAMTSILVVITHSLFNAALARLPTPEIYISAFAVAKSFMHLAESPMMMMNQTVATLVEDKESYYRVRKFFIIVGIFAVLTLAVIVLTGTARWIFKSIMGLEGKTLDEAVTILKVLIVFPGVVTLRGFLQGISIKLRVTPLLTLSTVVRIIFTGLIVLYIKQLTEVIPPGIMAGLMFLSAAFVETVVMYLGSKLSIGNIPDNLDLIKKSSAVMQKTQGGKDGCQDKCNEKGSQTGESENSHDNVEGLSNRAILYFFAPLVITAFIKNLAMPIINTGLGRTHSPELAISAYAVAWGLGTIVTSPLNMFHQVPLNFFEDDGDVNIKQIRKLAIYLGIILTVVIAFISFTEIGYCILKNIIGATHEISVLAVDVLKIMVILPLIIAIREFYWGILMKKRMTKYIGGGKTANLMVLVLSITVMTVINPSNPAIIGIVGMICCESTEAVYLYIIHKRKAN
jgi:hypothetical protein